MLTSLRNQPPRSCLTHLNPLPVKGYDLERARPDAAPEKRGGGICSPSTAVADFRAIAGELEEYREATRQE